MHSVLRTLLSWCLLSLSAFVGLAYAQQDDLYSVRVAVENQSAAARYEALQEGLRRVLVKITGNSDIDRALLPRANGQLEEFVSEYLYQPPLEPAFHETGVDLVARFMPGSVDRIVRDLGLPVWPASRPRVLVWLVTDSSEGPRYLSADQIPELERALLGTFEQRAVAMRQPLLDLEDQFALPPEEAWSLDPEVLHDASQRYSAPVVLLLRLQPPPHALALLSHVNFRDTGVATDNGLPEEHLGDDTPWWAEGVDEGSAPEDSAELASGVWGGEWLLLSDEEEVHQGTTTSGELAAVMATSVNAAIDALARTQAYLSSDNAGELDVLMEVRNLLTFEAFQRAEAFVRGMEMVQDLRLVGLEGDRAQFELVLTGGGEVFLQSLRNSGHFNIVAEPATSGRGDALPQPAWGDPATDPVAERHGDGNHDREGSTPTHDEHEMAAAARSFHFSWVP